MICSSPASLVRRCASGAIVVLLVASAALAGRSDLRSRLAVYEAAADAAARRDAVRGLSSCEHSQTVPALARIAREDRDIGVRLTAVDELSRVTSPGADATLHAFLVGGGSMRFRAAVARGLASREGGRETVLGVHTDRREDRAARVLATAALAHDGALDALAALHRRLDDPDAAVRCAALRALALHPLGGDDVGDAVVGMVVGHPDLDSTLTALDVIEDHALDRLGEVSQRLAKDERTGVRSTLERLVLLRDHLAAVEARKIATRDGYGTAESEIPESPGPRSRLDVVFAFDATGSSTTGVDLIRTWIREQARPLQLVRDDVRIGVVAYRDRSSNAGGWETKVLALTYDTDALVAFVDGVDVQGADGQGASIEAALAEALDRMDWRPNSRREVRILTDSRPGDGTASIRIARRHREADRTQTSVWYRARTRSGTPEDLIKIAEAGGGTFVRIP